MRSTTASEPLFTDMDTAWLMALAVHKSRLCPCGCGNLADDTLSPEEGGPAFTASYIACRARIAMIELQHAVNSSNADDRNGSARLWLAEKQEQPR